MFYQEDTLQQTLPDNTEKEDLVCLSHLRWDFVYERPQHLMSRFAHQRRIFFIEEPVIDRQKPYLDVQTEKYP